MAVEIKELIIRATVDSKAGQEKTRAADDSYQKDELVRLCVEEVLRILARSKER